MIDSNQYKKQSKNGLLFFFAEILIIPILAFLVFISFSKIQEAEYESYSYFDFAKYSRVYNQIRQDSAISSYAPFVYRLGTPYLAAKISPKISNGENYKLIAFTAFQNVNLAFLIATAFLLIIFLRLYHIDFKFRILFYFLFCFNWQSGLRAISYTSFDCDASGMFFIMLSLILLKYFSKSESNLKYVLFSIVSSISIFFREVSILPFVAYSLSLFWIEYQSNKEINNGKAYFKIIKECFSNPKILKSFIPILFAFASMIFIMKSVNKENTYQFQNAALGNLYNFSILKLVHSWIITFGPIIFLLILFWKNTLKYLKSNLFILVLFSLFVLMSIVGGSDTERIAWWSFPIIFILIYQVLSTNDFICFVKAKKYSFPILSIILIVQIISMRIFFSFPKFEYLENGKSLMFFTPINKNFRVLDLYNNHGNPKVILAGFIEYLLLFVFIYLIFHFYKKNENFENNFETLEKK